MDSPLFSLEHKTFTFDMKELFRWARGPREVIKLTQYLLINTRGQQQATGPLILPATLPSAQWRMKRHLQKALKSSYGPKTQYVHLPSRRRVVMG